MESKLLEGRLLRWGASERRERPTSASTRARIVSIAGIEVLMLSSAIPIQAVANGGGDKEEIQPHFKAMMELGISYEAAKPHIESGNLEFYKSM